MEFIDLKKQYLLNKSNIDTRIAKVLEEQNFILGEEVLQLEQLMNDYTNSKSVGVANGTDALMIALMAMGIQEGDEVITPSFTWVSTIEVIKLLNAKPVYVDINPDTFNIDESLIEERITPQTKCIIPVSLFGRCPDLSKLMNIAKVNNLKVLEDAAQSYGAKSNGMLSCSITDIATTSFFPAKPLGCYGDGGAIFSSDKDLIEACRIISRHGQSGRYNYVRVGVNSRLDTIQAAILLEKHKIFEDEIVMRNNVARHYEDILKDNLLVKTPSILSEENRSVWAQYTIILDDSLDGKREDIMAELKSLGVPTALYYPAPLHLQSIYFDDSFNLINTTKIANSVLSLPMHPYLEESEIEYVCSSLSQVLNKFSN